MPKPDGGKEDLGIIQLDEPALNCEDKTVLELKYVQSKNVVRSAPMTVDSIEGADKKPKEISRWINSINELQKTRPAPTVNYSKQMPDFDQMMSELHPELEDAMSLMGGAEIDMHSNDYARIILALLDVPVHKL
jgi:intraflagellar transport protein 46